MAEIVLIEFAEAIWKVATAFVFAYGMVNICVSIIDARLEGRRFRPIEKPTIAPRPVVPKPRKENKK